MNGEAFNPYDGGMAESLLELKIKGLKAMVDRMDFQDPLERTLGKYIQTAGETIAGSARSKAPVDVGTLRSSINAQYRHEGALFQSVIGTNLHYAPYMEFGTGTQHDHPNWPRNPHRIPPGALEGWATRKLRSSEADPKQMAARAAYSIMRNGGLKPRRFLRSSFEELQPQILDGIRTIIRKTLGLA